jgi:ferrous iron transport protein B
MTPFMSCGAKMPVYALFGAAFFGRTAGTMVFMIYLSGIALGVVTGLLLKHTLFQGEPSHFIMELPPYHLPRLRHILLHTWSRLKIFLLRAGKVIVPMIMILGFLNAIGRDGKIGNEDTEHSLLSVVGKAIAPVFEPMGVARENWPASVALCTGLFAKEAVVGTLNSLYGQMATEVGSSVTTDKVGSSVPRDREDIAEDTAEKEAPRFWHGIGEAFATIPKNLSGVLADFADPLHLGTISGDEEAVAKELDADASLFGALRASFGDSPRRAFAYLLFILLYVPCMAAMGAVFRELGKGYGTLMAVYLTVLGWSVATLYYQISMGHQPLWIAAPVILLCAMFASFWLMGRNRNLQTP